jgi:hypothetical protein
MFRFLALMVPFAAWAGPWDTTQQGRLVDASGNAISGSLDLTFTFYSGAGATLATVVVPAVPVTDGYYSVRLAPSLDWSQDVRVGVTVPGFGELAPRAELGAAPRAQLAHGVQVGAVSTCDSAHAGTIRFEGGRFEGCDGTGWVLMSSDYGSQDQPGLSCAAILARRPGVISGPFWLDPIPTDSTPAIPVFCDMSGGWVMLGKASNGSAEGFGAAFLAGATNVTTMDYLDRGAETGKYANTFAGAWWTAAGFTEVKVELWRSGAIDRQLVFNAAGQTNSGWFAMGRLTSVTGWTDLPNATFNDFSINGSIRDFYISKSHGGCQNDFGWLALTKGDSCDEWHDPARNRIAYSGLSTAFTWTSGASASPNTRFADVMVILAR